jgi:hypothetical protein
MDGQPNGGATEGPRKEIARHGSDCHGQFPPRMDVVNPVSVGVGPEGRERVPVVIASARGS